MIIMMGINNRSSHIGERVLFETRPRFIVKLNSAIIKIIIIILLLYFFRAIINYAMVIQGNVSSIANVPVVEGVTYGIIILVILIFLWIIWNVISWRAKKYVLTNQRVLIKMGVLRTESVYMHYNKIQDIIVTQSVMERISYSGDIEIFGGHDRTSLILEDIPNPGEVENMINRMIEGDDIEFKNRTTTKPEKSKNKPEKEKSIIEEYDKKFKLK